MTYHKLERLSKEELIHKVMNLQSRQMLNYKTEYHKTQEKLEAAMRNNTALRQRIMSLEVLVNKIANIEYTYTEQDPSVINVHITRARQLMAQRQ